MPIIEEILKLPKEKQLEIMEAIQDHLEDEPWEQANLSAAHINFINTRVQQIKAGNGKTFSWSEVKEKLTNRWNTL
jgi:putative addiction module component (TIGR02574 family)